MRGESESALGSNITDAGLRDNAMAWLIATLLARRKVMKVVPRHGRIHGSADCMYSSTIIHVAHIPRYIVPNYAVVATVSGYRGT